MLPPRMAWQRLAHMQHVVWSQPEVAYAVWHMSLLDQLELTVELLTDGLRVRTRVAVEHHSLPPTADPVATLFGLVPTLLISIPWSGLSRPSPETPLGLGVRRSWGSG